MANNNSSNVVGISEHSPIVRDGLCRRLRSKGMIVNIDEKPENGSSQRNYLAVDTNAMAYDGTVWWCTETSKTIGPDDRPCDSDRCQKGRRCFEGEQQLA